MEYIDDKNAAVDDTGKRASEKHRISTTAIVDALGGASTGAELQRQEALVAMEPAVPFAVLVRKLPGPGGAVEPVRVPDPLP
jgi:hypothetical protein